MQRWSKEPRNCLHDVYCLTSISKFPTKAYQETHKNKKKIPKEQRTDPLPFYLWWCLEGTNLNDNQLYNSLRSTLTYF